MRGQIEKLQAFDAFDDLVKAASVKVDAELQTDFATETGTMRSWLESQEVGASVSSFAIPLRQTVSSSRP